MEDLTQMENHTEKQGLFDEPQVIELDEATFFRKKEELSSEITQIPVGETRVVGIKANIQNTGASYCMELYGFMPDSGQIVSGHYPTTESDPKYTNEGLEKSVDSYKQALSIIGSETDAQKKTKIYLFGQDITGTAKELQMRAHVIEDLIKAGVKEEDIVDLRPNDSGELHSTLYSGTENAIYLKRSR